MISEISIRQNAANPNVALSTFYAFVSSYSNVRVKDIPSKIGTWELTALKVRVSYPDNTTHEDNCVNVDGVWVSTLPPSTMTGKSANGYQILASGIDEDGSAVDGYVLGSGDVVILDIDPTVSVDNQTYYLHMKETRPENPVKGDSYIDNNGMWHIYTPIGWADFMTSQVVINTYSRAECDAKFRDKNDLTYMRQTDNYYVTYDGATYECARQSSDWIYESDTSANRFVRLTFAENPDDMLVEVYDNGTMFDRDDFVEEVSQGEDFDLEMSSGRRIVGTTLANDPLVLKSYVDSKINELKTQLGLQ